MAKTFSLKALWPLLPFEAAAAPLLATWDSYGGELVKYAVTQDGVWLFSPSQPLTVHESEGLTGFHPADLVPMQIDGVEGYFYAMQGGAPLLPLPFTKDQLLAFDKRTGGLIGSCIERGGDTDAWIIDLEKDNPDAAILARGIHGGNWLLDLADIVDAKTDGAAKPHFRLAKGIEAAENRPLDRDREHRLETARLEEIARQDVHEEYEMQKQTVSPTPATNVTPVVSADPTIEKGNGRGGPSWRLTMPKRFQGYGKPLYDHLKAAHVAGKARPTARSVLDDWKLDRPNEVTEISNDGLKYYGPSGNTKPADLAAIRKVIERMTK